MSYTMFLLTSDFKSHPKKMTPGKTTQSWDKKYHIVKERHRIVSLSSSKFMLLVGLPSSMDCWPEARIEKCGKWLLRKQNGQTDIDICSPFFQSTFIYVRCNNTFEYVQEILLFHILRVSGWEIRRIGVLFGGFWSHQLLLSHNCNCQCNDITSDCNAKHKQVRDGDHGNKLEIGQHKEWCVCCRSTSF